MRHKFKSGKVAEKLDCLVMSPYQTLQVQGDMEYSVAECYYQTALLNIGDTQNQGHTEPSLYSLLVTL